MSYFVVFITGLLLGLGVALFIYLKGKWTMDELVKQQAEKKAKEVIFDVIKTKMPGTPSGRMDLLNSLRPKD